MNKKLLLSALLICISFTQIALADDFAVDNTTTTTTDPTTSTTTSTTTTTSTVTTTTTTTLSSTTTEPVTTTTTTAQQDNVLSFNVTKPDGTVCLRARFALSYAIQYAMENTQTLGTYNDTLLSFKSYSGECNSSFNTLKVDFASNWSIWFNYTLDKNVYRLSELRFAYVIDDSFQNASKSQYGEHTVQANDLKEFSTNKDSSYKCNSATLISLNDTVTLRFTEYQAQPFMESSKSKDFDTAVECAADLTGTSTLVPIIVGSALAVLVVLVLVAYIIGRRKHRPGYQQV